ncbi:ABC transporter permease [Clavibacter michiganensis]|uniref:Transport permease protein n=1 Tax=Clavibacter michiganensis TaxID=28447 RepID=A0A399NYA9_9MICO|nr:ABC transporter permease [Clavibacter michiganensis]
MTVVHAPVSVARTAWLHVRSEVRAFWSTPVTVGFIVLMPVVLYLVFGIAFKSNSDTRMLFEDRDILAANRTFGGVLVFGLMAVSFANVAIGLAMRRGSGMYRRLRTTAAQPVVVIGAFLVNVVIVSVLMVLIVTLIGTTLFGVRLDASKVGSLIAALALGACCFMALGVALSLLPRSGEAAVPIVNVIYFPLAFLSGAFFDVPLGAALQNVVNVLPVRPVLELVLGSLAEGDTTWSWGDVGVLGAWTVVGVLIAGRWFRWAAEREPRPRAARSFGPPRRQAGEST